MNIEIITILVTTVTSYLFAEIQKRMPSQTKELIPFKNAISGLIIGFIVYAIGLNGDLVESLILALGGATASTGVYEARKAFKPIDEDFLKEDFERKQKNTYSEIENSVEIDSDEEEETDDQGQ